MSSRHLEHIGLRVILHVQMLHPAAVVMMAMAVVVMVLVMMNGFARLFRHMLNACLTAAVAAIVHSIVARSGNKEEQDKHNRQYVMKHLANHFFSGSAHDEWSGQP